MSHSIHAKQFTSQSSVTHHLGCVLLLIIIHNEVMDIFVHKLFSLFKWVIEKMKLFFFFFFVLPHHVTPWPGIAPIPFALET